jgi:hypothetical protein
MARNNAPRPLINKAKLFPLHEIRRKGLLRMRDDKRIFMPPAANTSKLADDAAHGAVYSCGGHTAGFPQGSVCE